VIARAGAGHDRRDGTLRVLVMSPGIGLKADSKTWRFTRS
jgi:hypothetical protein